MNHSTHHFPLETLTANTRQCDDDWATAEKPMIPILFGSRPILWHTPSTPNGLQRIVDAVRLRIIAVGAEPVAQYRGIDSVHEKGDEVSAFPPTFRVLCPPPAARIITAPVFIPRSTG